MKNKKAKFIFITGGVCSSLGKGVTVASLGSLLEAYGYSVALQKIDPYINVDPGTMSPFQHGEVFVTKDGAETDLDLGHYERFTNSPITKKSSITTGKVYLTVIERERRGEYLGKTVQVVPHITDEIKRRIYELYKEFKTDFIIVEIGGTVGDIESVPFIEAIRQIGYEYGRDYCMYIHLTLVPKIGPTGEYKTKPTQHSVKLLMEIGIQPDVIICRVERKLTEEEKRKISLFSNVSIENVISAVDVSSIYELPILYHQEGLDRIVLSHFSLPTDTAPNLSNWENIVYRIKHPKDSIKIAVVGKYIELKDAYLSIYEAITHSAIYHNIKVDIKQVDSEDIKDYKGASKILSDVSGILVPGGFGGRGIEGKILAIKYGRENNIPTFGICLGMQCMCIEFARNVLGLEKANSTEFDPDTPHPIISLMEEQKYVEKIGATMRLGEYPCKIKKDTKIYNIYGKELVFERHRHRFEFNNEFRKMFEENGFIISGIYEEEELVEIIELKNHFWFIGVQFHPEFSSKPSSPHPLFISFIQHALKYKSTNTS